MTRYYCLSCGENYPPVGLPHHCACGGVFSVADLQYTPETYQSSSLPGMWQYKDAFGLDGDAEPFYLGEGATALVADMENPQSVCFKCEHLNPSGSFKDRQSAVLMSLLKARGIHAILEDSSGNAGASVAQYAAAAGVKSHIFIPSSSAGPKRQQIVLSGAKVNLVDGLRSMATTAVLKTHAETGVPYASHAWLPFGLAAYATIAFEIYESLGRMPGRVFAPIGHGSLFLGLLLGFEAIEARTGERRPQMIGVQAENCAPVYRAWKGLSELAPSATIAEGTAVIEPVRMSEILARVKTGYDMLIPVKEDAIARSYKELAAKGLYVEPTAAMVWAAWTMLVADGTNLGQSSVLTLSGNGLKSIEK
jgi:threonine synthase